MKKTLNYLIILLCLNCNNVMDPNDNDDMILDDTNDVIYILCQGNFNSNNATLHVFKDSTTWVENTGDVGQTIARYNDKVLIVNNGSSNIVVYNDSSKVGSGLEYSTTIDLNGSQPREIEIIGNHAFVSQWINKSILKMNLDTYEYLEIPVSGSPEGLTTDGTYLYATILYKDAINYGPSNLIEKINIETNAVIATYTVSNSPEMIIFHNDHLYVNSKYGPWGAYNYVTEKIDPINGTVVARNDHGSDIAFGNDFAIINNKIYRSYNQGLVALNDENLNIELDSYIESTINFTPISMEINKDKIYLGFSSDYLAPDTVEVLNLDGETITTYEVGAMPGAYLFKTY